MINKIDALKSLRPTAEWVIRGDNIEWLDNSTQPTNEEINSEIARLTAEFNSTQYQRDRAKEYPSLTELADALYHQQNGDDTKMTAYLAKCEAVKQKYPKE